jgi:hypothetical protein
VDFAGREVYRKKVTYEQFIDIYLNVGEISLKNYENYTVWYAFESRGVTVEYAVPPNSERTILLLFGDYLVNVYNDNFTTLFIRDISLTTTNKTSLQVGIPTTITIPDPIDRNLWELFGIAFQMLWDFLTTDPIGMLLFYGLIGVIGILAFIRIRGRAKRKQKKQEQQYKEGYEKGWKDGITGKYRGKNVPKKKAMI